MVEIKNSEDLKNWLNARPKETRGADAVLIASRAALRAAPHLVRALDEDAEERRKTIILPVFRAMAVASFAGTRPKQATQVRDAAAAAGNAASAAYPVSTVSADNAVSASNAAFAAASFADNAVSASNAALAAAVFTAAAPVAAARADVRAAALNAVTSDATSLETVQDQYAVASSPLWPDQVPGLIADDWNRLSAHLISSDAAEEGWQVWIDWYETRLRGTPTESELELARCLIADDLWEAGPKVVNQEIARLRKAHGSFVPKEADEKLDGSSRSSHSHSVQDFVTKATRYNIDPKQQIEMAEIAQQVDTKRSSAQINPNESKPDVPPTIAFFSYTRNDDRIMRGLLSKIRQELENTLALYHGEELQVFQDTSDIEGGAIWRERLEQALTEATIFVPMITPAFFKSKHCREELLRFLSRDDAPTFVLPVHLINTDFSNDKTRDDLIAKVEARQWIDWRKHARRYEITDDLIHDVHDAAALILERWREAQ